MTYSQAEYAAIPAATAAPPTASPVKRNRRRSVKRMGGAGEVSASSVAMASPILAFFREEFGFRVNTFTHILEGYKLADEMATHGASAVGFSDWWGYKFEVIDAIPYSGYVMWDRGVNTGFNSDDSELARRLNTEAAKAIKYGGVPPEEAIKFVTLNPARSLKIDDRVGSLVVGKDADFSIWNGSPLSPYSACEQTWIEGRKYFDRAEDLAGPDDLAAPHEAVILGRKRFPFEFGVRAGDAPLSVEI